MKDGSKGCKKKASRPWQQRLGGRGGKLNCAWAVTCPRCSRSMINLPSQFILRKPTVSQRDQQGCSHQRFRTVSMRFLALFGRPDFVVCPFQYYVSHVRTTRCITHSRPSLISLFESTLTYSYRHTLFATAGPGLPPWMWSSIPSSQSAIPTGPPTGQGSP